MVTSTFTRSKLKPTPLLQIYSFYALYCLSLRQFLSSSCPGQKLCSNSSFFFFLSYSTSNQLAYTVGFLFQIHQNFYYVLPSLRLSSERFPRTTIFCSFFFSFDYSFQMISVLLSWSSFNLLNIAARMILLRLGQILRSLCSVPSNCSPSHSEKKPKSLQWHVKPSGAWPLFLSDSYPTTSFIPLSFWTWQSCFSLKAIAPHCSLCLACSFPTRPLASSWSLQVLMPIALAHKDLVYPLPKTRLQAP